MNEARCVDCQRLKTQEDSILILIKENGILELKRYYGIGNTRRSPIGNGILKCQTKRLIHYNHNIYKTRKCGDFLRGYTA